jgi:hypothetical protein
VFIKFFFLSYKSLLIHLILIIRVWAKLKIIIIIEVITFNLESWTLTQLLLLKLSMLLEKPVSGNEKIF